MRIRCPSCSAIYQVADALLDPPRVVRCVQCSHDWMAEPIAEDLVHPEASAAPAADTTAAPAADASSALAADTSAHDLAFQEPVPAPVLIKDTPPAEETPLASLRPLVPLPGQEPAHQRRGRLLTAAWAASFVILAALGVAGYTERNLLMRHWPASKRLYARLGLIPPAGDRNGGGAVQAEGEPRPPAEKPAQ